MWLSRHRAMPPNDKERPLSISVVIPAYNSASFMRETLASVFAQRRQPDEALVVDDASTDGTLALVRELAVTASVPPRLIELPKDMGGPAAPMNVGIEAARSAPRAINEVSSDVRANSIAGVATLASAGGHLRRYAYRRVNSHI